MDDGDGEWGFAVYEAEDVWLCTITYLNQQAATRARHAIIPVLAECVFLATEES